MGIGWRIFLDQRRTTRRREGLAERDEAPASDAPHSRSDAAIDANRLLAGLSPQERAALNLCFGHGWSHGEADEIMGLQLGTPNALVLRGGGNTRTLIHERWEGGRGG